MTRVDGRSPNELRPLRFERNYLGRAPGSVLACMGNTAVLCTCSLEPGVPAFLVGTGKGWLTAEYGMLPGSTSPRKPRDRAGKVDGRSVEIQRLIGRSLRAVVDLDQLGERTLWVDCDVIEADGGTRVAGINGAYLAVVDALTAYHEALGCPVSSIVHNSVAAVSVGLLSGVPILDLNYQEDRDVDVDLNVVMTGDGRIVEIQAGGEEATFSQGELDQMLSLGKAGILAILEVSQCTALGPTEP